MTALWRRPFDAIERPLAAASEAWVQSDTFMDLTAVAVRVQRRMTADVHRFGEQWLHAWGLVARGDVTKVSNQVAALEREIRELSRELDRRQSPGERAARQSRSGGAAENARSRRTSR